jgi:hypothetical protein
VSSAPLAKSRRKRSLSASPRPLREDHRLAVRAPGGDVQVAGALQNHARLPDPPPVGTHVKDPDVEVAAVALGGGVGDAVAPRGPAAEVAEGAVGRSELPLLRSVRRQEEELGPLVTAPVGAVGDPVAAGGVAGELHPVAEGELLRLSLRAGRAGAHLPELRQAGRAGGVDQRLAVRGELRSRDAADVEVAGDGLARRPRQVELRRLRLRDVLREMGYGRRVADLVGGGGGRLGTGVVRGLNGGSRGAGGGQEKRRSGGGKQSNHRNRITGRGSLRSVPRSGRGGRLRGCGPHPRGG